MKTSFILALLFCAGRFCYAQEFINGFAGYSWGTDFRSIDKQLLGVQDRSGQTHPDIMIFRSPLNQCAGFPIKDCMLRFKKGGLDDVSFSVQGNDQLDKLSAVMGVSYPLKKKDCSGSESWRTCSFTFEGDSTFASILWYIGDTGIRVGLGVKSGIDFEKLLDIHRSHINFNAIEEANGFRGHRWGTLIDDFDTLLLGLCLTDSSVGEKTCDLNISKQAGATLDSASALFYKSRLCSVWLFASGYQNFQELLDAMEMAYGKGVKPNKYIDKYFWQTDLTTRILYYNNITGGVIALLGSREIVAERDADRIQRAKSGVNDF